MADPWNLTLDQSVFDSWCGESRIVIKETDFTETYKLVQKLSEQCVNQTDPIELERQLSISFSDNFDVKDVVPVLQMIAAVSQKLSLLPVSICQLTIQTCKHALPTVLALNRSKDLKQYFDCLECCLRHVKISEDSVSLITICEIIEQSYSSCSNKTINLPDELFKHSSEILMTALPIIEQKQFGDSALVGRLLVPLMAIGKFSCKLDARSMALIWKLVLKTMQHYPDLCPKMELGETVVFLVQEVFYLFDLLYQNNNNISKLAKVAGFLIKVIIGLSEKDTTILENESVNETVLDLVFQLLQFTPDAVKYKIPVGDDLVRLLELHVSIAIHPILEKLTKTRQLLPSLLKASSNCSSENQLNLIRLLGLLLTPNYQLNVRNYGITTSDILAIFLSAVNQGHAEFNGAILLHGITHSGKGIHTVPIYELLVTQAASAMAITTQDSVVQCVAVLLKSVLQDGFWAHLMSCDILTFMARYGPSQFCLELVQHLFLLSPSTPTISCRPICLINRLIPLLSPAGRAAILKSHPVEKYPDLWAAINWDAFTAEQKGELRQCLPPFATSSQLFKASAVIRLGLICTSGNDSALQDQNDLQLNLIKTGTVLLFGLKSHSAKDYQRHMEHLLACVLRVLLSTAQPAQKESHLCLMQILKLALDSKALTAVQLDTTIFLSKIGSSGIAISPQQIALLRVVANLFCETTTSRSFLVQLRAFYAFELFFKTTPHSHLASSCVREGNDVVIKRFISRVSSKSPVGEIGKLFSSQLLCLRSPPCNKDPFPKLPIEVYALPAVDSLDMVDSCSSGSLSKRPRMDNGDQLPFLLNSLAKVVAEMGQLGPLPMWSKEEIKERINMLKSYL
ncbi:hypothetical protein GHT06_010348 [Daphnia sinensis]|uniref:Uncharacterized protein n=1 Tax=Daphnia sinensis TaxID=1820382 RepID=A0AAD5PXD9_9CRUS|nr:hypothetical protein GHT06_010348 [Daphnia sinensis]